MNVESLKCFGLVSDLAAKQLVSTFGTWSGVATAYTHQLIKYDVEIEKVPELRVVSRLMHLLTVTWMRPEESIQPYISQWPKWRLLFPDPTGEGAAGMIRVLVFIS